MKEAEIVRRSCHLIRLRGGIAEKYHGGPYSSAGVSDIVGAYGGYTLFLEAKQPGQKPTALQLAFLRKARLVPRVIACVIRSPLDAQSLCASIDAHAHSLATVEKILLDSGIDHVL